MSVRLSLTLIVLGVFCAVAQAQQTAPNGMIMDHTHEFALRPDGGFIEMQRYDDGDAARIAEIRQHIEDIGKAFAAGDFRVPPGVDRCDEVPGTRVMKARLARINFAVESLPRGARLVIHTNDRKALRAVQEFLDFHRREHQAMAHRQH